MKKITADMGAVTRPAGPDPMALSGAPALRLLGPPALCRAAAAFDLPGTLPGYLIAYLGHRQDWVPREELSAVLWPQAGSEQAQHNLRANVLRAREWLASHRLGAALLAERTRLRLALPCDSAAWRALRRTSAAADAPGVPAPGGVFLQAWSFGSFEVFAEWAGLQRRELLAAWRDAIVHAPANAVSGSFAQQSLAQAERYLEADPLDEDVMRCRLQALLALGRGPEAAQALALFDARQCAELGVPASPALTALVSEHRASAPAAAAGPPLTEEAGLQGRQEDLQQLLGAWQQHRLVSLVGLGGIGKSALARAALSAQSAAGAATASAGLWLPLAHLHAVAELPRYWAELAGLRLPPGGDAVAHLGAALAQSNGRVVLDNAEHLLAEPGALSQLLESLFETTPGLRILVTSREPLRAQGEHVLRLQGLALPSSDEPAAILASPAVRLLAAAVRQARGGFDPRAELPGLAAIARATGGMPLALKIAGAWARLLPCVQIAAEIERSLTALDATPDGASGVRATLARSWASLQAPLPVQLAVLSVFVSPFTTRAAQDVAQATLASLTAMVDAGWLNRCGEQHLQMHPLVRAYAGERLAASAKTQRSAQEGHATWVRQQLKPWTEWQQIDQQQALLCIAELQFEASAAWHWALAHGRADFITDAAGVLSAYYDAKGLWETSQQQLNHALKVLDPQTPADRPALLAVMQPMAGLLYRQSEFAQCEALAERALELAVPFGNLRARRNLLNLLGTAQRRLGRQANAESNLRQALELAREAKDLVTQANSGCNLASLLQDQGQWAASESLQRESLAVQRELRNWYGVCGQLNNLGNLLRELGQNDAALALYHEALALADAQGFSVIRNFLMANCAIAHLAAKRLDRAREWAERSLANKVHGEGAAAMISQFTLARIHMLEPDPASAHRAAPPLLQALRWATQSSNVSAQMEAMLIYGLWCGRQGQRARKDLVFATLVADVRLGASLRREIEHEGQAPPGTPAGDFTLLLEQALAELDAAAAL